MLAVRKNFLTVYAKSSQSLKLIVTLYWHESGVFMKIFIFLLLGYDLVEKSVLLFEIIPFELLLSENY